MAWELPVCDISLTAYEDLSSHQFKVVKVTSDGLLKLFDGDGVPIGILQDDPGIGQAGRVRVLGVSRAVSGASFYAGTVLTPTAAGKVVEGIGYPIGVALEAATGSDQVVTVLVAPSWLEIS